MYYHGVVNGLVTDKILKILDGREIASMSRLGASKRIGFNENDYISVCVNLGEDVYSKYPNNAFNKYIVDHFCFVIEEDIPAIKTEYIDTSGISAFDLNRLKSNNPNKRFSDIIDEYQVRDCIPIEKIIAIGIPYDIEETNGFIKLSNFCFLTRDEFLDFIKQVEGISNDLGLKIVNSSSNEFKSLFNNKRNNI